MNASGLGYYDRGNYAMAVQEFQTAVASSPQNPDYLANLAKARAKMGDPASAERLYQQALAADPAHQPAYHGYAELMMTQNRSQEALRLMNRWAATQPYIPESHVELAWLQRELGQHDAAAQSLQTALQMNPNHATALAHLGQYYQDTGNPTQAVALYQRSLRADWSQPEVHSRLASAAESAGANHPMGAMAMSRGVHPASLARRPSIMTRNAAVPPMMPSAQPFPQPQLASSSVQPWQPIIEQPAPTVGSDLTIPSSPYTETIGTASAVSPFSTIQAGGGAVVNPSDPVPVPDPEFASESTAPVMTISNSTEVESGTPEIEAF